MDRVRFSPQIIVVLVLTIVVALSTVVVLQILSRRTPDVRTQFTLYLEKLEPQSMVVVATTQQRYEASKEFTATLLAIFNLKAKIRLSAVADVTYVIPASDPSAWSINWDSKSHLLELSAPAPECLLPAVHTDTIEIITEKSNLVTNSMFKLKEQAAQMQAALSNDLLIQARASLKEPEVRATIEEGLRRFGRTFCESAHLGEPQNIQVRLGED